MSDQQHPHREVVAERVADPDQAGERLDQVLARWLAEPRARAQRRIAAGEVRVDGEDPAKSHRLRAGERVVIYAPAPVAREAPPEVPVRWEDQHLAVVAKPPGLVVHAGAGVRGATLVDALTAQGVALATDPQGERPGIVHRLDRGTSGLLLVAKDATTRAALVAALRERAITRGYWALCEGVPHPPHATIDAPIARHPTERTRFVIDDAGRPARSHYEVVEDYGRAGQLGVRLETGRTHQVRVHLSAIGHPIVADTVYGASQALADELRLRRPALHAQRLRFTHPSTGETIDLAEPPTDDLQAAVAALRATRTEGHDR